MPLAIPARSSSTKEAARRDPSSVASTSVDGNGVDDDYLDPSLAETTDVELLKRAWRCEKVSPEILPFRSAPIQREMLSSNTTVIAETCDSWFNCQKLHLLDHYGYEFQMQYGSIGWSPGATLGYAQVVDKRVIACIGDGSFQEDTVEDYISVGADDPVVSLYQMDLDQKFIELQNSIQANDDVSHNLLHRGCAEVKKQGKEFQDKVS